MRKIRGFTLVELMVTVAVVGVLITLALPSFMDLIERKHLGGAVEAVYEQLEFARSQAVKRSKPMLVDFYINGDLSTGSTDWSIGVTDKMAGCNAEDQDVSSADACTVDYDNDASTSDSMLMRVDGDDYKSITMSQATAFNAGGSNTCPGTPSDPASQVCFRFLRGLADTGAYNFTSTNDTYTLQLQVDQMGRLSVCVPSGKKYMAGYEDC